MQILDKNKHNDTKWTVLFDRTSKYPSPGSYIAVSEDDLNDIIIKANSILEKNDTFLQSSVTTMSEANFMRKIVFAPCAAELNAVNKFDVVLKVEEIVQTGKTTYVRTNCPFINMPIGVDMLFKADDAIVVEVKIGTEKPLSYDKADSINMLRKVSYQTRENTKVTYEALVPAPPKVLTWLSSNLVKEFSLIFDFTKEIEQAVNEITIGTNTYVNDVKTSLKPIESQPIQSKPRLEIKSLNSILNDEKTEANSQDNMDYPEEIVAQHPLYMYTSDVVIEVLDKIEKTCRFTLESELVSEIMENSLKRMLATQMSIIPPPPTED